MIHAAFGQRRKTLVNALDSAGFGNGKESLQTALANVGLDPRVRGETLDLAKFAELTVELGNIT